MTTIVDINNGPIQPLVYDGSMKRALIVLILISLGGGWMLYLHEHNKVVEYQRIERARTEIDRAIENNTPAVFDRIDGSIMYFRIPSKIETDTEIYVNYQEHIGTITNDTRLVQTITSWKISEIPPGTNLALDLSPDPNHTGQYIVNAIFLAE